MKKVRVGVVGIGKLGEAHLHHFLSIPGVQVSGIFDQDKKRLEEIAEKYEVNCFRSVEDIWKNVDAVSVVVSTVSHYSIAKAAMEHGLHVFIEKPMTTTLVEADDLLRIQSERGGIVQIGLIERFNPAFTALKGFPLAPVYIESHRLSPFTHRGADVSVVLDLMIHDIDIILSVIGAEVRHIEATGFSAITETADYVNARLGFSNGAAANITASRIAPDRMRKMRLFQPDSRITVDFLKRESEIFRYTDKPEINGEERLLGQMDFHGKSRYIVRQAIEVPFVDAMQAELQAFIRSVRGEIEPVVTAAEGRKALEISLAVMEAIGKHVKRTV